MRNETIPLFRVAMDPAVTDVLRHTLESGYIGQGPKVEEFEQALEPYMGSRPVTVNSATSGLTLALYLAGVRSGTAVISTPMTCSATNLPIVHLGADILWADVDPRTGLIDPESVDRLMQTDGYRVSAIMAVDWGGAPCDYKALRTAARSKPIIEDAAHAIGAAYRGRHVGQVADYTVFSFQAIKHLTTGDGGAVTVPEDQQERARTLRWFGIDRTTPTEFKGSLDITEAGWKYHMNDIAATIGLANLRMLDGLLRRHRAAARLYDRELDDRFVRTSPRYDHTSSWWMYTTLLGSHAEREAFRQWMAANKITVSQVHWRNDKLSVFRPFQRELPGLDHFSSRMICLPTHWQTRAPEVVASANEFWEHA